MATAGLAPKLLGRQRECAALDRLLDAAREGHGGVLVLYGEPGVGKTALVQQAVAERRDFHVARALGVEGEMELPYAALQQLCAPSLERLAGLPEPQREALQVALGLSSGRPPSPFLVGLAVLNLLSEVAAAQPVLCVVDDAQWLDRASTQVLAFVARRLVAERIAMVFAAREPLRALGGVAELHLEPLGHRDARALLDSVLLARLDERVLERIVVETRGNPLALVELPRGLTPSQLAGGFGLPGAVALSARIEQSFARRLLRLSRDERRLLLVAAADPTGDAALEWRAAKQLGVSPAATARAGDFDGLLASDGGLAFRHPLARSAVYGAAEPDERSKVHRALADATDPLVDPDRRAWHRAQAATAPDEDIAAELARSAERAQARGGFAAAGAFLERASVLTMDPGRRATRAIAAAWAKQQAGALDEALALVSGAEAGPLDDMQRAKAEVIRARTSFAADRGRDAPARLLAAAERVQQLSAAAAREIYLDALTAALFAGCLGGDVDARRIATLARGAAAPQPTSRAADLLLDGLATVITEGPGAGTAVIRKALTAFSGDDIGTEDGLRWLWLAGRAAGYIWDYENWEALTRRQVRLARESGALTVLPLTLSTRAGVELFAGNLTDAAVLIAEGDAVIDATDGRNVPYAPLALAAFRGREPDATQLIQTSREDFIARGEGMGLTLTHWATAFLHNGLARYETALAAAEEAAHDPRELWFSPWAMVELIEAAVRCGQPQRAASALDILRETTQASGSPWAQGIEARARALVSDAGGAEPLYREALHCLQQTPLRVDLARAHLLYGEWLRRERRRLDARAQLRSAHELFSSFGMDAYAERARVELEATGEHARKRSVDTLRDLTPQEAQISRLVAQGDTNHEIAARLFVSPNTVEYHLRKVYRKLDVKSRTQLAHRLRG